MKINAIMFIENPHGETKLGNFCSFTRNKDFSKCHMSPESKHSVSKNQQ